MLGTDLAVRALLRWLFLAVPPQTHLLVPHRSLSTQFTTRSRSPLSFLAPEQIAMSSGWASFRKHWVRPEIYPLVGSLAVALGVGTYALLNKALDPTIPWNKTKRTSSLHAQLEGIEEVIPVWNVSGMRSTRVFTSANDIRDNKRTFPDFQDTFVVKVGGDEEEEEVEEVEEDEGAQVNEGAQVTDADNTEEQPAPEAVEVPPPALEVMDEAAEQIHAAVDTALQVAAHASNEPLATDVHKAIDTAMQSAVKTTEEPATASSMEESNEEEGKQEAA